MAYYPIPATAVIGGRKPPTKPPRRNTQNAGINRFKDPTSWILQQYLSSFETPAQREARATRLADTIYNRQLAAARESTRAAQAQAQGQMQWISGLGQAMHGLANRESDLINQTYSRAGTEMGDFARALSYGIVAPQEQAAIGRSNATLAANLPGQGQAVNAADPQALAGVSNYLGGVLPASDIAAEKAAQTVSEIVSADKNDPVMMGLLAQQLQAKTDAQSKLLETRMGLEADRAKTISDQLAASDESARQNAALIVSMLGLQGKNAAAVTKAVTDQQRINIAQQNADTSTARATGVDKNGNLLPGYYRDPQGRVIPKGFKVNAQGQVVPVPKPKSPVDVAKEKRKAEQDFRKAALSLVKGLIPLTKTGEPRGAVPKKADLVRAIYRALGVPLLNAYPGWTEAMIKQWANQVVNSLPMSWWAPRKTPSKTTTGNAADAIIGAAG